MDISIDIITLPSVTIHEPTDCASFSFFHTTPTRGSENYCVQGVAFINILLDVINSNDIIIII